MRVDFDVSFTPLAAPDNRKIRVAAEAILADVQGCVEALAFHLHDQLESRVHSVQLCALRWKWVLDEVYSTR